MPTQPTRRVVILGGAALGLIGVTMEARSANASIGQRQDPDLAALTGQFDRLRRRVRRTQRRAARAQGTTDYSHAWTRWSHAVDECADLAETIVALPATTVSVLAIRYQALLWTLLEDDGAMDRSTRRALVRFGRDLQMLAQTSQGDAGGRSRAER